MLNTLEEILTSAEKLTRYTVKVTGCIDGTAIVVGFDDNDKATMFQVFIPREHSDRAAVSRATSEKMRELGCTRYSFATGVWFEGGKEGIIVGACDASMALVNIYSISPKLDLEFIRREENTMTPLLVPFTTLLLSVGHA